MVAGIVAGMVAMTFVARQSGEALRARLGGQIAQEHAAVGRNLIWFAIAMFLVSGRRRRDARISTSDGGCRFGRNGGPVRDLVDGQGRSYRCRRALEGHARSHQQGEAG